VLWANMLGAFYYVFFYGCLARAVIGHDTLLSRELNVTFTRPVRLYYKASGIIPSMLVRPRPRCSMFDF
jgi:hypothetical protein